MSRKSIIFTIVSLSVIYLAAGWLSYSWVLNIVTAKIGHEIVSVSVQETFNHRLMMSLTLALMGAISGFGTFLSGRFSAGYRYGRNFFILFSVAVLAVGGWTVILAHQLTTLSEHLAAAPILPYPSLLLSEIHLYQIGIFGSGCVFAVAIILRRFPID